MLLSTRNVHFESLFAVLELQQLLWHPRFCYTPPQESYFRIPGVIAKIVVAILSW